MKSAFCKVCFDTGKSEAMYTSHYVNDVPGKAGVVVCPTLLALQCRYCKQTGHTVSRCKMIPRSGKKHISSPRKPAYAPKAEAPEAQHSINRFRHLEEEVVVPRAAANEPITYASILCSQSSDNEDFFCNKKNLIQPRSPSTSPPPIEKKIHWANCFDDTDSDCSDSESK